MNITNYYIGINIGSVSVNLVKIDEKGKYTFAKRSHLGKPREVLDEIIKETITSEDNFYGVCGSFGETSEIVAVEHGIQTLNEKFDIILSLGGEAVILYVLNEQGHIVNVLSHDKCAAGSGEFFIQQIDRLGISLPDAIELALKGTKVDLASRCSVHCKSDITHKLNRGEASVEDLLTSVLASMASKMKGLVIQSRVEVKRLLVIGGVSLNKAFIKLLKEELVDAEVVVKDISPVFEAYGMAQIVKETPKETEVNLHISKSFSTLPALNKFSDLVTIIEPVANKKDFKKDSPFILGVDVGSTTTKAVLIDPEDSAIIASYYGRTSGNPVEATKKCITEIISQVDNLKVNLVGVTGSGRSLVGAYLGTSAVYNEISAHAEGAVFYDAEVDTIFEIGGQDSKYMYLQNGVPVDYAMNATCSAGTGSFLEESAKGDLGIDVLDISKTAIEAKAPVRFQADCAAFINTDIRTALQEDYSRENIIGGLVYSIADNYLNKVKGPRPVGKKVFFQGGVAKNHSVGHAFAEATGTEIIIPPSPELMGAYGIGLIAKNKYEQHEISAMDAKTTLKSLIKAKLKHLSSFTCKACKNFCRIERYEVGGRKFSFGGSCTRYEHQWKGTEKIEEKEDLVEVRHNFIFRLNDEKKVKAGRSKGKIGIARALTTHSLYPLLSTFIEELGYEVVLSGIDDDMELMTNASFCFPTQILHGAVMDLVKQNVTTILLPHVHTMPKAEKWRDSTFCPITQASPYIISSAFRDITFLTPLLDYVDGYENDQALIRLAVIDLNESRRLAIQAYEKAVKKQVEIEEEFLKIGKETIEKLDESNEIGIVLVGRSYNAFPAETSLKIPKKFASMGVTVIPFDFLEKESEADIPWFFSNYVKTAINLALKHDNLFVVFINSFSCTIDAFVQSYLQSEMKHKPYLMLELDAHTADAGIQTRLEAFLEIIKNHQTSKMKLEEESFQVAKVKTRKGKVVVLTSEGNQLDIKDPRVKLYLPCFSKYHSDISQKIMTLFGFHFEESGDMNQEFLVKGYRYSSGKECIPLPAVLGQIMTLVENRKPGEIIGMFMIRGGAPCAVYSYFHYIEQFLKKYKIENVFMFRFDFTTGYLGMKFGQVLRYIPACIIMGDLMLEIESALQVVGAENSLALLKKYWSEFLDTSTTLKKYRRNIKKLIKNMAQIPRTENPDNLPKVIVSGDFFVRFSDFFLSELKEIYGKHGILVKSTDLFELGIYGTYYNGGYLITKEWNADPHLLATRLRATVTPWDEASRLLIMSKFGVKVMLRIERRIRKRFDETGLLYAYPNDLGEIVRLADPWISRLIFTEATPTIGKGLETLERAYFDSLILTGPFNCLPYKISQAILKPIYLENNMPFLIFDVDMSAITPNMKRLIHANIEQIKRRRIDNASPIDNTRRGKRIQKRVRRRLARKNRKGFLRIFRKKKHGQIIEI